MADLAEEKKADEIGADTTQGGEAKENDTTEGGEKTAEDTAAGADSDGDKSGTE